ncbi:hypothetical protein YPPY25_4895, partial [Yersinia pestis PY-25]
MSTVIGWGKT